MFFRKKKQVLLSKKSQKNRKKVKKIPFFATESHFGSIFPRFLRDFTSFAQRLAGKFGPRCVSLFIMQNGTKSPFSKSAILSFFFFLFLFARLL